MESTSAEPNMALHGHNLRIKVLEKHCSWLPIQLDLKYFGDVGALSYVAVLHLMMA